MTVQDALPHSSPFTQRDRFIVALLVFYVIVAFTVELYWIVFRNDLVLLAETDFIASLFRIYAAGDREYFDIITPLPMALEAINVFVTQGFNVLLIHAIWNRRPYRYPLQLFIGSYLAYSVVLYFTSVHVDGYQSMGEQSPWGAFLLVVPNLPWLLGAGWMAYDAFIACHRQFQAAHDPVMKPASRPAAAAAIQLAE